jgi:hypothetical protein
VNPHPPGHVTPAVHVAQPGLPERELAQIVHHTWTCATCGASIVAKDAKVLRQRAQDHARACRATR